MLTRYCPSFLLLLLPHCRVSEWARQVRQVPRAGAARPRRLQRAGGGTMEKGGGGGVVPHRFVHAWSSAFLFDGRRGEEGGQVRAQPDLDAANVLVPTACLPAAINLCAGYPPMSLWRGEGNPRASSRLPADIAMVGGARSRDARAHALRTNPVLPPPMCRCRGGACPPSGRSMPRGATPPPLLPYVATVFKLFHRCERLPPPLPPHSATAGQHGASFLHLLRIHRPGK